MKRLGIAVVLATITISASATQWVFIGTNQRGGKNYIDGESIKFIANGSTAQVWAKEVFEDGYQVEPKAAVVNYYMVRQNINCVDKTTSVGQTIMYGMDGAMLYNGPGTPDKWEEAIPDSKEAYLLSVVCKLKSRPSAQ